MGRIRLYCLMLHISDYRKAGKISLQKAGLDKRLAATHTFLALAFDISLTETPARFSKIFLCPEPYQMKQGTGLKKKPSKTVLWIQNYLIRLPRKFHFGI